jgi:hypothetical protein
VGVRLVGKRSDPLGRVDGPELRHLTYGDDARLAVVLVAEAGKTCRDALGRESAVGRRDRKELAPGKALGRTALVGVDVRRLRTYHGLMPAHHRRQTRDVRPRPVEHEERAGIRPEVTAEDLLRIRRERVVPIRRHVPDVRRRDRLEHGGMDSGRVVARESPANCVAHPCLPTDRITSLRA